MATPKRLLNLSIIDKPSIRNDVEQYDALDGKDNLADRKANLPETTGKDLYTFKKTHNKLHKYIPKTPFVEREHKRLKAIEQIQDESSDEDDEMEYFGMAQKTSDNQLNFTISQQQIRSVIESGTVTTKHAKEILKLNEGHELKFGQFKFELSEGFSLLFYGYGSKQDLLLKFAKQTFPQGPILEIRGYHPNTNIKQIFSNNCKKLELENFERESIDNSKWTCITLIVHNIEGKCIRKDLNKLADLSQCTKVNFIASCDHINSAIIFDNQLISKFKFLWHDLTTFRPYNQESTFEDSFVSKQKKTNQGILFVLSSLPHNAQKLFKLLAESQLQITEDDKSQSFEKLFRLAREGFVVDNQISFRTLLTEFKDHEIVTQQGDNLKIAMSDEEIKSVIEQME